MLAAGRALGREIIVLEVRRLDFDAAFATLVEQRADALIVGAFSVFLNPHAIATKYWSSQHATR